MPSIFACALFTRQFKKLTSARALTLVEENARTTANFTLRIIVQLTSSVQLARFTLPSVMARTDRALSAKARTSIGIWRYQREVCPCARSVTTTRIFRRCCTALPKFRVWLARQKHLRLPASAGKTGTILHSRIQIANCFSVRAFDLSSTFLGKPDSVNFDCGTNG